MAIFKNGFYLYRKPETGKAVKTSVTDPYHFPGFVSKVGLDPDPTKTIENLIFYNIILMIICRKVIV